MPERARRNHATSIDGNDLMWKNSARYVLASANLLIAGSAMAATPIVAPETGNQVERLNAASVKAVESSWLAVPNACKARGMNADPHPLAVKSARPIVQHIYAAFGF